MKKVGLFDDYEHSPECSFGEVTLVFGENGVGKSTIAAILDSLRENNPAEMMRRKSLPGDTASTATVTLDNQPYTFDGTDWDGKPPHNTIDIFFPGFVSRNVHAASGVDAEHRRNLCELVLGRDAVTSAARLAEVDVRARETLAERKRLEAQIQLLVKRPDSLDSYLALPQDPSVDQHLEEARVQLRQAQDKNAVLGRPVPAPVELPLVNQDALDALLKMGANGIGSDVAAIIQEHIRRHLDADGETWLAYGAGHTDDGLCPFCGQSLAGSELADTIQSYFGAEYRAFTRSLSSQALAVRESLGGSAFASIRSALSGQMAIVSQWADEHPVDQASMNAAVAEAEDAWTNGATRLEKVMASKLAQPLPPVDPRLVEEALGDFRRALAILDGVNATLSACKDKAEARKRELAKVEAADIEERVYRLENQKSRYEPIAEDLIAKRGSAVETRRQLEEDKATLKEAIDNNAKRVVGKYQEGINHYLEYFGCDIRIESVEAGFPSGRASVQYKMKVRGHDIPLGVSDDSPCFETVLSEGDKYTLALSFFLARLKDQKNLSGRVVVLDDPVNSLGSSRRTLVEGIVRDLRVRGAQVVVFTHDERLAALMWRDKKLNGLIPLQVERTNKGSRIRAWDIERATQSEYVKDYLTLADYLENGGDHEQVARCVRPYVEQRLRHLHPGPPLETRDSLGTMIRKIGDSKLGTRLYPLKDKLSELESINDAALPSHHASDDVPGWESPTPEVVRVFAQKALGVLE